jgi:hypothetical protein
MKKAAAALEWDLPIVDPHPILALVGDGSLSGPLEKLASRRNHHPEIRRFKSLPEPAFLDRIIELPAKAAAAAAFFMQRQSFRAWHDGSTLINLCGG